MLLKLLKNNNCVNCLHVFNEHIWSPAATCVPRKAFGSCFCVQRDKCAMRNHQSFLSHQMCTMSTYRNWLPWIVLAYEMLPLLADEGSRRYVRHSSGLKQDGLKFAQTNQTNILNKKCNYYNIINACILFSLRSMNKKGGSCKRNNYIADKLLNLNSLVLCEVGRGTRGKIIFFHFDGK